jgi:hypothetical protein
MIKPKLTFFKKQGEVIFGDTIIFSQDTFGLVPEVLDAVYVIGSALGKVG